MLLVGRSWDMREGKVLGGKFIESRREKKREKGVSLKRGKDHLFKHTTTAPGGGGTAGKGASESVR